VEFLNTYCPILLSPSDALGPPCFRSENQLLPRENRREGQPHPGVPFLGLYDVLLPRLLFLGCLEDKVVVGSGSGQFELQALAFVVFLCNSEEDGGDEETAGRT